MSTFNPSNGSITGPGIALVPPFTSQAQIDSYMQALQGVSSLRKKGIINIPGNLGPDATIATVATGNDLPAVQVYNIPSLPLFAIVYTDSNGASSFSYKNDPTNRIRLVQNGSRIDPLVSGTGTVQQTSVEYATSSTQESSGGGILGIIGFVLLFLIIMGFIGFIVYMAVKKFKNSQISSIE